MIAKKIKILIKSDGSYLDTILPPITANEDGRTIVQVIAPFPITDIVSVNYSIRPIQATVKGSYLLPTGKFGKDVLDEDYTHFQTVADWNVFEIPINAVALEYISKYRAGLVLVSFTIKQLQTPYFATSYLGLFSNTQPIPATSYNDGDYFIANEYNFTAHDITWAKGDYAYFYNGKWNKGKSVLKASTPSIELPVDPSLKDAPQLEYDEDVALLLANDLGLLTQRVSQSETDIESAENDINEIDGRVGVNETDIYNLESDVDDLETEIGNIKNGTTIVKKAEQDANGNNIVNTYETKNDATNKLATKVDKTQKIIGINLQDDILLTEFKTALGNATQSVAGLLSVEDKTHLDGLVALLESSDGNNVVDTIGEILAIFNNYPEGADLVTALNGKVDKVAGKALSQNDFTDALKNKLDGLLNGSQYYDKTYIDALKDKNGWESELLGTLSNNEMIDLSVINQYDEIQMYAKDTLGVIDNENIRPSLMQSGDSVYFFDDTQAFIMVDTVFGFYAPVGYTLQVVGIKYTELKAIDTTYDNTVSEMTATNVQGAIDEVEARVDTLETFKDTTVPATYETKVDVTSKLAQKADVAVVNEINREQDYRIATIEEAYRKLQSGELTATKNGTDIISLGKDVAPAPLQVKVDGDMIPALENLVTGSGPTFSDTTGYSPIFFDRDSISVVNNKLRTKALMVDGNLGFTKTPNIALTVNNVYYIKINGYTTSGGGTKSLRLQTLEPSAVYLFESNASLGFIATQTNTSFLLYVYSADVLWQINDYWEMSSWVLFNLTASHGVTATSGTAYDNAVADIEKVLALNGGYISTTPIHAVGMNKRVRSVGKNLFDKNASEIIVNYRLDDITGLETALSNYYISDYISVGNNTNYYLSGGTPGPYLTMVEYDNNLNIVKVSNNYSGFIALTTLITTSFIRLSHRIDMYDTVQLEQGTVATAYVPYANTDFYLQANKVGYKLPNGVADTIEYRNGKYYYMQRVQEYTLQTSDIETVYTDSGFQFVITSTQSYLISLGNGVNNDYILSNGFRSTIVNAGFGELIANTSFHVGQKIGFVFPIGTYADLATAQTSLAGTVVYYQLATPIETEILALGNAQGLSGGTVYIDDIMADSNLYTSKYDIENTAYPIKSLDRIVKINADGSQTELAVSSAIIAGDGLSFTHHSLVANDIVWIAYAYNVANLFKSNTFVTYYDNPFIAVQPNGTPRRIVFAVDDSGVVTVSSQAV